MEKVRVYSAIWKFGRWMYAIDDITLPLPISYESAGYFGASLVFMIAIKRIFGFFVINMSFHYLFIPVLIAWFLSRAENIFDGKKPYNYLSRSFSFNLFERGKYVRYEKVKTEKKYNYDAVVLRGGKVK